MSKLSPFVLYGDIDLENCPCHLFYHYARSFGKSEKRSRRVSYQQLLAWNDEATFLPEDVSEWNEHNFRAFARFLNPFYTDEWPVETLLQSWNFMRKALEGSMHPIPCLTYGYPNPEQPISLSPPMVYALCRKIQPGIDVHDRSLDYLFPIAKMFLQFHTLEHIHDSIHRLLRMTTGLSQRAESFSLLATIFEEATRILQATLPQAGRIEDMGIMMDQRIESIQHHTHLTSSRVPLRNPSPPSTSPMHPIIERTLSYPPSQIPHSFLQISSGFLSDFEYGNYYAICLRTGIQCPQASQNHERICRIVEGAVWYHRDITEAFLEEIRSWEDPPQEILRFPQLHEDFNPEIPPKAYTLSILHELAYHAGLLKRMDSVQDEYQLHHQLCDWDAQPRFWPGICSPSLEDTTLCGEELTEARSISYGPRGGPYHVLDMDELSQAFQSDRTFLRPFDTKKSFFKSREILQLARMNLTSSLRKTMDSILKEIGILDEHVMLFQEFCRKHPDDLVETSIRALHDLGMRMRYTPEVDGAKEVDLETSVQEGIGNWRASLCQLEQVYGFHARSIFEHHPLWKYVQGEFILSHHEANTVHKRIELILLGERTGRDENSCIRLSSNYFCVTAYQMLKIFGKSFDYVLDDLRFIS